MRYFEITTTEQDLQTIGSESVGKSITDFITENPSYYIDYGEGGNPETHYPNLCETTEDTEVITAEFSVDGELAGNIIGGIHAPSRPK